MQTVISKWDQVLSTSTKKTYAIMSYPNFEPSLKNSSFVQNYVLRRKILFYYDFFFQNGRCTFTLNCIIQQKERRRWRRVVVLVHRVRGGQGFWHYVDLFPMEIQCTEAAFEIRRKAVELLLPRVGRASSSLLLELPLLSRSITYARLTLLTQLIPQQAALFRHRGALRLPEQKPGVGQKLFGDQHQHFGTIGITYSQHFSDLQQTLAFQARKFIWQVLMKLTKSSKVRFLHCFFDKKNRRIEGGICTLSFSQNFSPFLKFFVKKNHQIEGGSELFHFHKFFRLLCLL